MKMYYITLNNEEEAKTISISLLKKQLAVCTNTIPITCTYRWQSEIKQEPEVVLIIKTKSGMRSEIERVISEHINYTNFIAEIDVHSINEGFLQWLNKEVI
jgi:periplasmic divalent cation tolerance protein